VIDAKGGSTKWYSCSNIISEYKLSEGVLQGLTSRYGPYDPVDLVEMQYIKLSVPRQEVRLLAVAPEHDMTAPVKC
jgi:antitoxin component YwqK of YwqJK toxin-antitoxin module